MPLAAAIAFYWAGGTDPGLVGFLFTIALLGIPLGAFSGAAFAVDALITTRPILLAGKATLVAVVLGVAVYAVILLITSVGDADLELSTALSALASLIVLGWVVLGAWAFGMPYALVGVVLLRRVGPGGVSRRLFAAAALVLSLSAVVTAVDLVRSLRG